MNRKSFDLKPFELCWKNQPATEVPFLLKQKALAEKNKPYQGLRLIQNIPLSLESLCKLEVLIVGGADVTVACNSAIQPHSQPQAIKILKEVGIHFVADGSFAEGSFKDSYDFGLDCGGKLAALITPKMGMIELTQTGSAKYKKLSPSYPVLSVDDSRLKHLETFFGTGEAVVRAINHFTGIDFAGKSVVVFGYGKVGQGIAHYLSKCGAKATIVEVDKGKLKFAKGRKLNALHSHDEKAKVEAVIAASDVVITATGIKGLVASLHNPALFQGKILANAGVDDEFGEAFKAGSVLYNKHPVNFGLPDPTKMRYLDPILYAHNKGVEIILSRQLKPGYHSFPHDIDETILSEWEACHNEDLSLIA